MTQPAATEEPGGRLLIVAGEVSGDMHAAGVLREMRKRNPGLQAFGIGGDALASAGMELTHHVNEMAAVGLVEVLPKLGFFRRVFKETLRLCAERKPDAVLLVDFPDFNLRLAEKLHAAGHRVIYYVCPQVWAWRKSRIGKMAKILDRLIVLFPFEVEVFEGTGLQVDYAGHPLVDEIENDVGGVALDLPWKGTKRIALLPGSRGQEIQRLLPCFLGAARVIAEQRPDASFIVASPSEQTAVLARDLVQEYGSSDVPVEVVTGVTREVVRQADAALVASGTATIETALLECPMVVAYRIAGLTHLLLRRLVKLEHIGMVNIVAESPVCPEFIQDEATPEALAAALVPLLDDTVERREMVDGLKRVSEALRSGAHSGAADIVIEELARNSS